MHHIFPILRYLLITGLFLSCLLTIGLVGLLCGSLPQYEGNIALSGLSAPVRVDRDSLGSATLHGENRTDVAMAMGYVHAQERFFEMDLMRRQAAGELAELFGESFLEQDRKKRRFRMRARATQVIQQLTEIQQQYIEAYRQGVNQGIQALNVRPFPYLLTQASPAEWQREDSILVIFAMFFTLNEADFNRELKLSTLHAGLPESVYHFLMRQAGQWDAPLLEGPFSVPEIPPEIDIDLRSLSRHLFQHPGPVDEETPGSNSFAVAGALADGAALVANDMHLTLRAPNLWFRTRLVYPGDTPSAKYDISGISLPGVPAIVVGSNRHIAWSFTHSYGDFADWVRITTDSNDNASYQTASGWKPIETVQETIHIRNAPAETLTVSETIWGPILASDHDGTPLALSWTALHAEAVNLDLIDLEQARTAEQAARVAQRAGIPVQNFIVGDRQGNIGWTLAGRIPARSGTFDPQRPADWSKPDTGWKGWLQPEHYPSLHNPATGRLWSANSRMVSGDLLALVGDSGYDLGARATQIRDNLFTRDHFTAEDMQAIQLDHRALLMTRWYELLKNRLESLNDQPNWAVELQQALRDWQGQASVDSVAYRAVRTFRYEVMKSVLDGFAAPIRQFDPEFSLPRFSQAELITWQLLEHSPIHLLPAPYTNWEALLLHCARQTAQLLQRNGGITAVNWGQDNAARIRHPLSSKLPAWIARWLDMPHDPLPGDQNLPRIQSPDFGASQRSVVAPGQEESGYFDMPGGQSGHPLSPYYGSGHDHWVSGKPTPFLPGITEKTLLLTSEH